MLHQGAAQGDGCVVVHVIAPLFTRSLTARPRRVISSSSPLIASVTQRRHARDAGLKAPACWLGNVSPPQRTATDVSTACDTSIMVLLPAPAPVVNRDQGLFTVWMVVAFLWEG